MKHAGQKPPAQLPASEQTEATHTLIGMFGTVSAIISIHLCNDASRQTKNACIGNVTQIDAIHIYMYTAMQQHVIEHNGMPLSVDDWLVSKIMII